MKRRVADPLAAANTGSYSPALVVGGWVFVSGQGPIDPNGRVVKGTVAEETQRTMENVKRLLEAAGARMDQVAKCTAYLADIADFDEFDAVYRTFFEEPLPARTTVAATLDGIRVEIDAVACTL